MRGARRAERGRALSAAAADASAPRLLARLARWAVGSEASSRSSALLRIGLALLLWTRFARDLDWAGALTPRFLALSAAFFAATTAMLVGAFSRAAALASAAVAGFLYVVWGVVRGEPGVAHHHVYLLVVASFLCALTPCGRSYSLDRWLAVRRAERAGAAPPPERGNVWGLRLLALQLSSIYLWSAYDKLAPDFLSGARLERILLWFYAGFDLAALPGFGPAVVALSLATVALELALGVGLLVPRARRHLILPGLAFHAILYPDAPRADLLGHDGPLLPRLPRSRRRPPGHRPPRGPRRRGSGAPARSRVASASAPRRDAMTRLRIAQTALLLALAALAAACGGDAPPEPEFRWEEEVVEGPEEPPPRADARGGEDLEAPRATRDALDADAEAERLERRRREALRRDEERALEQRRADAGRRPGPRPDEGARGEAIYPARDDAFCDERVAACYTARGAHVGLTEEEFGVAAGRRLERRLEAGPRSPRGVERVDGAACDRLSEVCYERDGASVARTREVFGRQAARDLAARLGARRGEPSGRGEAIYAPRRGVSCDERVAACYVADEAHLGHTRDEFGRPAALALERRLERGPRARDGVYRPVDGAVCDRLSKVCYDRLGASAAVTRAEFGREAAVRMAERVR